jgi:hypothetical protein
MSLCSDAYKDSVNAILSHSAWSAGVDQRGIIGEVAHSRDSKGGSRSVLADTEIYSSLTEAQRQHARAIGYGAGLGLVALDSRPGAGDLSFNGTRGFSIEGKAANSVVGLT